MSVEIRCRPNRLTDCDVSWQEALENVSGVQKGALLWKNVCGSFGTTLNEKRHKILQILFSHFCLMGKFQHIFTDYD